MMIIPAKFQPSSSTSVGRKRGDRRTRDITPFSQDPYTKILNFNQGLISKVAGTIPMPDCKKLTRHSRTGQK